MKKIYRLIIILLLCLTGLGSVQTFSKDLVNEVKSKLPEMLGANNVGKEFWLSIPPCYEDESAGYANFIKLFVTSPVKTLVTVEIPGKGYFKTRNTIPNDVIEFNITPVQGAVWTKIGSATTPPDAVYRGSGIHITADQPIVVYCVVRYHWTSDGFLAFPTSSLGREYIASAAAVDAMFNSWGYKMPTSVAMTAAYDDTKVRFSLGGNVLTKTTGGLIPGATKEWSLMKGDVLLVSTETGEGELSGSKIVSTKPLSVVSGNYCSNIPTGNQWCDYTVEMDIPSYTWGKDAHIGKVPNRKFSSLIKIYAKEPNTLVYRNGLQIGNIQTSGGVEGKGFLYMRMTSDLKPGSVVISGNKPITVSLFNTGVQEDGYPAPNSDPFVMGITPVQQYQKEITFCTPGIMGGQSFSENYINLVYETDTKGMVPDHVEFAGPVHGGEFTWVRLNVKFAGVDELFPYNVMGKKYAVKTITLPGDGVYKIRSQTPFAAYSFGYSDYDSYGFPTSAALMDLEKPDTVAPVPTWTLPCTGLVEDGVVTDMPEDKDIRSNLSMIVFQTDFSFNYEFKYEDFVPGETRTTHWTLKVVDPSQDARALITFMDRRGNDTTIQIDYSATKLTIRPQLADFGTLKNGETKRLNFWVINESTQSSALVSQLKLKSGVEGFKLLLGSLTLPFTLDKGDSVAFQVEFTATAEGSFRDSIGVGDTCVFFNKSLVQAKVGNPIIFVDDITFSKLTVNDLETKDFHITNEGTVDLTITGYTGPALSVYTHSLPAISVSSPLVLKPKEQKTFQVTFKPTTVGTFPDKITFTNDAGTDRKNVCNIMGESMMPGLKANGYDWHERRINKSYPPDNSEKVIVLSNDGNQDIRITGVTVVKDTKGSAFKFDRATLFGGVTVPAKGSVEFPVVFEPTTQGFHELIIDYTNDFGIPTQSRLLGVGILPRLKTDDYDFGTTMIQDNSKKSTRRIVFKNLIYDTDTLSSDVATITDFTEVPAADIGLDGTTFGPHPWTYNKSAITFPVVLQPGDSVEFDAYFVAQIEGQVRSTLTSVSDAETEVTSNWLGDGSSIKISLTGASSNICKGKRDTVVCTITNSGNSSAQINSLSFSPDLGILSFDPPTLASGFPLGNNVTKNLSIIYTPAQAGTNIVYLLASYDKSGVPMVDSIPINLSAVDYTRASNVASTVTPDRDNNKMPNPGEDNINLTFSLDGVGDASAANATSLDVVLRYNGGIVKYAAGTLVTEGVLNGWAINNLVESAKDGLLTFNLSSNNPLSGTGKAFSLSFATFLKTSKDLVDTSNFAVSIGVTDINNKCLAISPSNTTIFFDNTCAYTMRSNLIFTGQQYSLSAVNPNPVGSNGAEISFGVGLDGYTNISVYNSMGELVKTLVKGNVQNGAYQVPLNVEDMNSGMYWIRMISGPFSDEKQLIISK